MDNEAISSNQNMIPAQNGYKLHHHSHNYSLQHRQGPYHYQTYPISNNHQKYGAYYHGGRYPSQEFNRENHVQNQIQVPINVYEATKLSINKFRKSELLGSLKSWS